ncbi:MAG: hypothetical protein V3V49_09810 [Candidatus Krumholzibacteria bacterium]
MGAPVTKVRTFAAVVFAMIATALALPLPASAQPDSCLTLAALDDGTGLPAGGIPDLIMSEISPGAFIELYNTTSAPIPLAGVTHNLCSPLAYLPLNLFPGVIVPAGGYATIPWPVGFIDTAAGGEILLFRNSLFNISSNIQDFVCWGVNPHGSRKSQAESVGKWAGACATPLTGGSIHRMIGTTGTTAASYDVTSPPSPDDCMPTVPVHDTTWGRVKALFN